MKKVIGATLLVLMAGVGFADIHVVDLAGGGDFTSIYTAVEDASSGDTVLISSGTYQLPSSSGAILVDKELHIMGSGYDAPEDGGTYLISSTQMFNFEASADGSTLRGLRMEGYGAPMIQVSADEVLIEDNHIVNSQTQGYIIGFAASTSSDTIRNNIIIFDITTSYRPGKYLYQTIDATVSNNIIANCSWQAGVYSYQATNTTVSNNIFLNSQYAMRSSGESTVVNNIFMGNSHAFYVDSGSPLALNNCFFNNTTNGTVGIDAFLENPDFVNFDENDVYTTASIDEDNFDFHLAGTSALINGGYVLVDFNDLDGSQNDPGIYGWLWPMGTNGAPAMPVINNISVTPSSVDPDGTISIEVIGRFGN
jgi:parallel beta-helix repeat protein